MGYKVGESCGKIQIILEPYGEMVLKREELVRHIPLVEYYEKRPYKH